MLQFEPARQAKNEKKKSECESEHAQMMDLQQVTEDVGIASNYLTYRLAKTPIKQKRNYLYRQYSTQCEPEFYNILLQARLQCLF